MSTSFSELKEQILKKLPEDTTCPICKSKKLQLAEGFFTQTLQGDFNKIKMGPPTVPTVILICLSCGYLMEFSVGILGLFPKKGDQSFKKKDEQK